MVQIGAIIKEEKKNRSRRNIDTPNTPSCPPTFRACYMHLNKGKGEVRVITVFTVFRLLTDFVCLYNYEF